VAAWASRSAERLGVEPTEIDGGHCPHVSRPEAAAEILDRQGKDR
jgi:hypothetical protein